MQEITIPLCFYGFNKGKRDLTFFMNNFKEKESRALQQRLVEVGKYKKFSEFCKEILHGFIVVLPNPIASSGFFAIAFQPNFCYIVPVTELQQWITPFGAHLPHHDQT